MSGVRCKNLGRDWNRGFTHVPALIFLLTAAVLLAGCPHPQTPTPTVMPAPPTATIAPSVIPAGWVDYAAGTARIALPADWAVLDLSGGDAAMLFAAFQATNPDLAALIGDVEALRGAALWAYRSTDPVGGFTDSLNIRRFGSAIADLAAALEPIVAQYRQLGFTVNETQTDLQIGGLPAASIAYTLPFTRANGQATTLIGQQYLVAAATETWIISFAASPETAAAMAPVFEESAQTFRVK